MNKKFLKKLLYQAYNYKLTKKEIKEFFSSPVFLNKEDEEIIEIWN